MRTKGTRKENYLNNNKIMETINTVFDGGQKQETRQQLAVSENTKTTVEDIVSADLMDLFGIETKKATKLAKVDIANLSEQNEVNQTEAQLAQMFGKYDEIMELNTPSNQPISLANVMSELDKN